MTFAVWTRLGGWRLWIRPGRSSGAPVAIEQDRHHDEDDARDDDEEREEGLLHPSSVVEPVQHVVILASETSGVNVVGVLGKDS